MHRWSRTILSLALLLLALTGLNGCSLPGRATPTATPEPAATATSLPATAAPATVTLVPTNPPPPPLPTIPPSTATTAPTATRPAPSPIATPGTSGTPPRPGPTVGSATPRLATPGTPIANSLVVEDPEHACAIALPPGFAPVSGNPGSFAAADGRALITLASLMANPDDTLDDLALPFVSAFIPLVTNYQQTTVTKQGDSVRIEFTGQVGAPGTGALAIRQFGRVACALVFFVADGSTTSFEQTLEALLASLRVTKAVG